MKRAAAIVLSLMLLWVQALASAPSNLVGAVAPADRCPCRKPCCVSQATTDSQSLPLAPATGGSLTPDFSALLAVMVAWTLPSASASQFYCVASAPSPVPAVPLFTRHCALLI